MSTIPTLPKWLWRVIQRGLASMKLYEGAIDGNPGTKTQLGLEAAEHAELHGTGAIAPMPQDMQPPRPPNYTQFKDDLTAEQRQDMLRFKSNWESNKGVYIKVQDATRIPAPLIAALHWRESTGNFHTYLHQGDKLGRPAVNVPKNIPVFSDTMEGWMQAASHALEMKDAIRDKFFINSKTTDLNALCAFAEHYNGLGYRNKGLPSPYVLSGTTGYQKGKYVADGKFAPESVDKQLGVLPMLRAAF